MGQIGRGQTSLDRSANAAGRVTIEATDDSKMWQEVSHKGHQDEQADGIELLHPYGFTSNVQPPSSAGKAEGVALYLTGDRSHGVVVAHGDRRFRPKNLQPGEVAIHDDQGQTVNHQRAGTRIASPGKAVSTVVDDQSQLRVQAGGYVLATVNGLDKLRVYDDDAKQWYRIMQSAFEPIDKPPDDPTHA